MKHDACEVNEILSTSTAARELNVAAQTVRLWERLGKLPAMKTTDGRRLFFRSDIEKLKRERAARESAQKSTSVQRDRGLRTPVHPLQSS